MPVIAEKSRLLVVRKAGLPLGLSGRRRFGTTGNASCPQCGTSFDATPNLVKANSERKLTLRKVRCPQCGHVFEHGKQEKVSKASVDFGEGHGQTTCAHCVFYRGGSCLRVEGHIGADDWCKMWKGESTRKALLFVVCSSLLEKAHRRLRYDPAVHTLLDTGITPRKVRSDFGKPRVLVVRRTGGAPQHEPAGQTEVNPKTGKTISGGQFRPQHGTDQQTVQKKRALPPLIRGLFDYPENPLEDIYHAVKALSARCDHASSQDGQGFNKFDADIWNEMADHPFESWTQKQLARARDMLRKYRGQLEGMGIDYDSLPKVPGEEEAQPVEAPAEKPSEPEKPKEGYWSIRGGQPSFVEGGNLDSERVRVKLASRDRAKIYFNFDTAVNAKIKTVSGYRFNEDGDKVWSVPLAGVPQLLKALGSCGVSQKVMDAVNGAQDKQAKEIEQAQAAQAALSDEDRNFKSNVLGLSAEEVKNHPGFDSFEREFLTSNLGKSLSQLSGKQVDVVNRIQAKHNQYLKAHPEKIGDLRRSFEEREKAKLAKAQEKVDRERGALEAQENHEFNLPDHPNREMLQGGDLFEHQKAGANWLLRIRRGILALATGLGKTNSSLCAFETLREKGEAKRMLWVVPKARLYGTQRDIDALFPGRKVVVIAGTPKQREQQIQQAKTADYVICGYDMVRRSGEELKDLAPDVVTFDECTRIKGKNSQVALAAREMFKDTANVWYLSATPIPNSPEDLFNLMKGINPEVFGSFTQFKRDHCLTQYNRFSGGHDIVGYSHKAETGKVVAPYLMYRNYQSPDVNVNMPEKVTTVARLDMGEEQEKLYRRVAAQMLEEAESNPKDKFSSSNALTNLLRLEQISLSPRLLDKEWKGAEPKFEETVNTITDHFENGESQAAIVFSHFVDTQPIMKQYLQEAGIGQSQVAEIRGNDYIVGGKRVKSAQDVVDAVNSGQVKVLLASDAAAEGLNLQHKANLTIHMDTPWRPDILEQREGRTYRPGQKNRTVMLTLRMKNSVEELKEQKVNAKAEDMESIMTGEESVQMPKITYEEYLATLRAAAKKGAS